jgi:hypothetical protein
MPGATPVRLPGFLSTVTTTDPLGPATGSPHGFPQYWQVSDGEVSGPRIRARLAAAGSDWMRMTGDGFWRPAYEPG